MAQKPIDQLHKNRLESSKTPKKFEDAENTHENAWKIHENLKKKGKRDIPASKDKNLAKNLKENDKNLNGGALSQCGEREKQEKVWIVTLKKSNSAF